MNTIDVMQYGHKTIIKAVDGLPETDWHASGVCRTWSVKDIIAHLASFEYLLMDVLTSMIAETTTPILDSFNAGIDAFNESQIESRRHLSVAEVWTDYESTYRQTIGLIAQIPVGRRRLNGRMLWYGPEYDLEDFIIYNFYGHKREHSAQIAVFRTQISSAVTQLITPAEYHPSEQGHSEGISQ